MCSFSPNPNVWRSSLCSQERLINPQLIWSDEKLKHLLRGTKDSVDGKTRLDLQCKILVTVLGDSRTLVAVTSNTRTQITQSRHCNRLLRHSIRIVESSYCKYRDKTNDRALSTASKAVMQRSRGSFAVVPTTKLSDA